MPKLASRQTRASECSQLTSTFPRLSLGLDKEDRYLYDKALGLMLIEVNDLLRERSTNISEWSTSVPPSITIIRSFSLFKYSYTDMKDVTQD